MNSKIIKKLSFKKTLCTRSSWEKILSPSRVSLCKQNNFTLQHIAVSYFCIILNSRKQSHFLKNKSWQLPRGENNFSFENDSTIPTSLSDKKFYYLWPTKYRCTIFTSITELFFFQLSSFVSNLKYKLRLKNFRFCASIYLLNFPQN